VQHRAARTSALQAVTRSRTTAQWIALLEGIAVPCGPINGVGKAFLDEQVQAGNLGVNQPMAQVESM